MTLCRGRGDEALTKPMPSTFVCVWGGYLCYNASHEFTMPIMSLKACALLHYLASAACSLGKLFIFYTRQIER